MFVMRLRTRSKIEELNENYNDIIIGMVVMLSGMTIIYLLLLIVLIIM